MGAAVSELPRGMVDTAAVGWRGAATGISDVDRQWHPLTPFQLGCDKRLRGVMLHVDVGPDEGV